jgi:hypothetical protein
MAKALKPGAIFVTFTKGLNLPKHFEVIERKRYKMSWGPATVFIHRRLGADGLPVGNFKLNLLPSDDKSYSDEDEEINERQRRFGINESDEDEDEDDYEDDYESEDDDAGDEEDDDDENDEDDDGEENDDDESDSSDDYELGTEQLKNPYAPQRSYYTTTSAPSATVSASRPIPPQPSADLYGAGGGLHVKVNPLTSELPQVLLLL